MDWILGLDLRPNGEGAVQFAAALARGPGAHRFFPLHVLEAEHLAFVLRYHHLDEVLERARAAARSALAPLLATGAAEEPVIAQAPDAAQALAAAVQGRQGAALIVGRVGRSDARGLVRLGRVARRLLRALKETTVVVPPDLSAGDLGDGPVVALVRPDHGESVLPAARPLAAALDRPLVALHVVPGEYEGSFLPDEARQRSARERLAEAELGLEQWAVAHGLGPRDVVAASGSVLECAVDVARERHSPLLVVGARPHPGPGGAWSVGRELAAFAPLPVAVVPIT